MKTLLVSLLIFTSFYSQSQSALDLEDAKPVEYNDFEYGFSIDRKTGWTTLISRKQYEEYIVTFFVKNVSNHNYTSFMYSNGKHVACDHLAEFNCINAIDKRKGVNNLILYGKPKTIPHAEKEFHTTYFYNAPIVFSKEIDKEVLVGYTLGVLEVVSATVTVIVPKGEKMLWRVKPYGK